MANPSTGSRWRRVIGAALLYSGLDGFGVHSCDLRCAGAGNQHSDRHGDGGRLLAEGDVHRRLAAASATVRGVVALAVG